MGGSTIGVWAAHGEGQALFPDAAVQAAVQQQNLAPIRYVVCIPVYDSLGFECLRQWQV